MLCGIVYIVQAVAPKAVPCRRARRTRLRLICARLTVKKRDTYCSIDALYT
jgi:hypothetical protein